MRPADPRLHLAGFTAVWATETVEAQYRQRDPQPVAAEKRLGAAVLDASLVAQHGSHAERAVRAHGDHPLKQNHEPGHAKKTGGDDGQVAVLDRD